MEKLIATRYCMDNTDKKMFEEREKDLLKGINSFSDIMFHQKEGVMDNLPDCTITATTLDSEEPFELKVTDGYYERMEKEMKEYSLNNSIKTICKELKEDESYYISWKSSIAMNFYDEARRFKREFGRKLMNSNSLREVANKAADNFLKQLI